MSELQTSCASVTEEQIAQVRAALLTMTDWTRDGQATPEQAEMLLSPYRELLALLCERDLQLAKLVELVSR
jgi:hypothetical protein